MLRCMNDLSMEISLIYENERQHGFRGETVRAYGRRETWSRVPGIRCLRETNIDNLAERDRLYSGSLSSIKVELEYIGHEERAQRQDGLSSGLQSGGAERSGQCLRGLLSLMKEPQSL